MTQVMSANRVGSQNAREQFDVPVGTIRTVPFNAKELASSICQALNVFATVAGVFVIPRPLFHCELVAKAFEQLAVDQDGRHQEQYTAYCPHFQEFIAKQF